MEKNNVNEINMDFTTYSKIKGKLNPEDKKSVTITNDKPQIPNKIGGSSSMGSSMAMTENGDTSVNTPKKIKFLSNVKDSKTGEISKPFMVKDKKYQMVRGIYPDGKVNMGVYSFDEKDELGENKIYPIDEFETNIANPMKEEIRIVGQDIQVVPHIKEDNFDYSREEVEFNDREEFMDFINLRDIDPSFKHFFVNIKTGDIVAKFKNTKEMIKSGIKLGPNEDYMDVKTLKNFRFGNYFKNDINETESDESGTNINKLQTDVRKLTKLIKNKFSKYLSKLDKPIEQAQFLTSMAQEVGVPLNKLSTIINTYKDIAKDAVPSENNTRIISKNSIEEGVRVNKKSIIIKAKDI